MLITFKSRADADVIMFGEIGQSLLEIFGKDPLDAKGIITTEQLPAAITSLRQAIEQDKIDHPAPPELDDWGLDAIDQQAVRDEQRKQAQQISLARRAIPLLNMLEYALRDQTPVTWES